MPIRQFPHSWVTVFNHPLDVTWLYHKPFNTLKSLFVSPRDKSKKEKQCGVVYSERDQEYIGETSRMVGTRFQELTDRKHPNSAIMEYTSSTSHRYTLDDTKILVREEKWFMRKIWEALHSHKRSLALNRDRGHEIPTILLQLLSHDPEVMWAATLWS